MNALIQSRVNKYDIDVRQKDINEHIDPRWGHKYYINLMQKVRHEHNDPK